MDSRLVSVILLPLLLIALVQGGIDKQRATEILTKCKAETGASEDIESLIDTKTIPETHEGKCMLACALRERGLTKDNKIDPQAVGQFLEEKFKDEPDKLEKAAAAVGACSTIDVKGLDHCEALAKHMQCGKDHMVGGL